MAYNFYRELYVDYNEVDGSSNHSNFPVLVVLDNLDTRDRTDNTYWDPNTYGTWDGSEWDAGYTGLGYDIRLDIKGTWGTSYRPSYISITYTGGGGLAGVSLYDTSTNEIASQVPYTSGNLIPITFVGNDIDSLLILSPIATLSVQSIDFYDAQALRIIDEGGHITDSNGYDIIFTSDSAGTTKLDHEVMSYDSSSGKLVAWVKIPTLQYASNTYFYLQYGNCDISTSQENVSGVWSNSYSGVWHLEESGNGTTDEFVDSSGNGNDGTGGNGSGAATPTQTTGKIGSGQSFDGGDFITMGNTLGYGQGSTYTFSAWIQTTGTSMSILGKGLHNGNETGYWFYVESGGDLSIYHEQLFLGIFQAEHAKIGNPADVNNGGWNYVVGTYSGNNNSSGMNLYVDGTHITSVTTIDDTTSSDFTTSYPFNIGAMNNSGSFFNGKIDEVRTASVVRSADWISTEYNNQNSPSTFVIVGSEVSNLNKFISVDIGYTYMLVPFCEVKSIMGVDW